MIVILAIVTAAHDVVLVIMVSADRTLAIGPVRKACGPVVHINHLRNRLGRVVARVVRFASVHPDKADNEQADDDDTDDECHEKLDDTFD